MTNTTDTRVYSKISSVLPPMCSPYVFVIGQSSIYDYLLKKLVFVPVASAMTVIHRDRLVLASNAQWLEIRWLEIWSLTSRGQIVYADLL